MRIALRRADLIVAALAAAVIALVSWPTPSTVRHPPRIVLAWPLLPSDRTEP